MVVQVVLAARFFVLYVYTYIPSPRFSLRAKTLSLCGTRLAFLVDFYSLGFDRASQLGACIELP